MFTFSLKFKLPICRSIITKQNIHMHKKAKYNYFTSDNVMDYRKLIQDFQTTRFSFETLLKYKILLKTPVNILEENFALCKEHNVIFMSPIITATLLALPPLKIRHNIGILKECGSIKLTDYNVSRLTSLMKLQIDSFKQVANIPEKVNIAKQIYKNVFLKSYDSSVFSNINENMTIFELRSLLLPHYVSWQFKIPVKVYPKHPSFRKVLLFRSWNDITLNLDYLKKNIGYRSNNIIYNVYAAQCDLNNIRSICQEIKSIGQLTIKEVILKNPRILTQTVNNIKEFLTWYRQTQLNEFLVVNCLRVLLLNPAESTNNIEKLLKNPILVTFRNHPKFLYLLFVKHDLTKRIAYLRSRNIPVKWKSITAPLSDINKSKGYFKVDNRNHKEFLINEFPKEGEALSTELQKNSNWNRIEVSQMFESLQYLRNHFSMDVVCSNIHIILYHRLRVEKTLSFVRKRYENYRNHQFTPSQQLALCLYHLEVEYHFSGDSVLASLDTKGKQVYNKI